jgi:hypothetical protein
MIAPPRILQTIYTAYDIWQKSTYDSHIAVYYNLHVKRYLFLNGRRLDQLEYAPAPSVDSFGIAGTEFSTIIKEKLQRVRDADMYCCP